MTMENAHFTLAEIFDAFHRSSELCRPIWRASFEICCMALGLNPAREWERQVRRARQGDGELH